MQSVRAGLATGVGIWNCSDNPWRKARGIAPPQAKPWFRMLRLEQSRN